MRTVEFKDWHLEFLMSTYKDDPRLSDIREGVPHIEDELIYTLFEGGELIAIIGILKMWEGLGECLFYKTPFYDKRVLPYTRVISRLFDLIQVKGKFHRIQAAISMADQVAIRFAEFLKFEIESSLTQFGTNKEDYLMFVRFEPSREICHS